MNIFEIPLYYISFDKKNKLEDEFKSAGFKNINFFNAVNGKKLNIEELFDNKKISVRAYNDLITKARQEHSGLPSLGALGCSMSHINLWEKCIRDNLDYMIVAEDDIDLKYKLKKQDIEFIQKVLSHPNALYVSPFEINYMNGKQFTFYGTHFYIISKGACQKLLDNAYPIDVQIDSYMSNLMYRNIINAECKILYVQKFHMSSIQDICIKCLLPTSLLFYVLFVIIIAACIYYYYNRTKVCERIFENYIR